MTTPPDDPTDETFVLSAKDANGDTIETALTSAQALDLVATVRRDEFHVLAYFPHDEQLVADEDGQIIHRDSALPRRPDPREDRP